MVTPAGACGRQQVGDQPAADRNPWRVGGPDDSGDAVLRYDPVGQERDAATDFDRRPAVADLLADPQAPAGCLTMQLHAPQVHDSSVCGRSSCTRFVSWPGISGNTI